MDTGEPSGISLLKLNYEFACCIISSLTPFVCLFVQCIVAEGVRDHSWELFLFFRHVGFKDQIRVLRLCNKCPDLVNRLAGPCLLFRVKQELTVNQGSLGKQE